MAEKNNEEGGFLLPKETEVEVWCQNGKYIIKKIMALSEAVKIKPKTGWKCQNFKIGECSLIENLPPTKNIENI